MTEIINKYGDTIRVGQNVRIRPAKEWNRREFSHGSDPGVNNSMFDYVGREFTVKGINSEARVEFDWYWHVDWLEPVEPEVPEFQIEVLDQMF